MYGGLLFRLKSPDRIARAGARDRSAKFEERKIRSAKFRAAKSQQFAPIPWFDHGRGSKRGGHLGYNNFQLASNGEKSWGKFNVATGSFRFVFLSGVRWTDGPRRPVPGRAPVHGRHESAGCGGGRLQ